MYGSKITETDKQIACNTLQTMESICSFLFSPLWGWQVGRFFSITTHDRICLVVPQMAVTLMSIGIWATKPCSMSVILTSGKYVNQNV